MLSALMCKLARFGSHTVSKCEAQDPLVQFAAIAPFLAEKMRYQSGSALRDGWRVL